MNKVFVVEASSNDRDVVASHRGGALFVDAGADSGQGGEDAMTGDKGDAVRHAGRPQGGLT